MDISTEIGTQTGIGSRREYQRRKVEGQMSGFINAIQKILLRFFIALDIYGYRFLLVATETRYVHTLVSDYVTHYYLNNIHCFAVL